MNKRSFDIRSATIMLLPVILILSTVAPDTTLAVSLPGPVNGYHNATTFIYHASNFKDLEDNRVGTIPIREDLDVINSLKEAFSDWHEANELACKYAGGTYSAEYTEKEPVLKVIEEESCAYNSNDGNVEESYIGFF